MKNETNNKPNKKYILPNPSDYIKNGNLLKSIKTCQLDAFISLTNKNSVTNISFEDYPNLLVYGIQRSGKSNFIENIIFNILLKSSPSNNKLIIIDTRRLEYASLNGIPHLICPIIFDYQKAYMALDKVIDIINARYDILSKNNFKDIEKYNSMLDQSNTNKLPKLFIIIDDLIDLVEFSKSEIVEKISLIIQKGRQVGVYIIVATSNISRDLINISFINHFSNRICFRAYSERDSKLLLNKPSAEKLNEFEYYLNSSLNVSDGKYKSYKLDDESINNLINFVSNQKIKIDDTIVLEEPNDYIKTNIEEYDDPLYNDVVDFAISTGKISASLIQRRFRIGFSRAVRMIDLLEERGIIGPQVGSKPREVLIKNNNDTLNKDNNDSYEEKNNSNSNVEQINKNCDSSKIILIIIGIIILSIMKYLFYKN